MVLTRLLNRALRFVYCLRKFDHISEYRLSAGVMSVEDCFHLQTVKLIHKVLQTGRPEYLRRKLVFRHEHCDAQWNICKEQCKDRGGENIERDNVKL
ncbi:hypothetical protein J6590_087802 [Homalodisca vitripennis]|nr:hypothetical protein J6590_087802 [Homalodisca vitripennis]